MVTAPLGLGRRIVAPLIPAFHAAFPGIEVRLRLSDRKIDYLAEGVDVAFALGTLEDSSLKMRTIADCERVLCAAPDYLARRGAPETPARPDRAGPQLPAAALPRLAGILLDLRHPRRAAEAHPRMAPSTPTTPTC